MAGLADLFDMMEQSRVPWPDLAQAAQERDLASVVYKIVGAARKTVADPKAAAGDKDVTVVGGPNVIQQCVAAKLADELHVDIMPVLLGNGQRLFEHISDQPVALEKIKVLETPTRTSLQFRIIK